MSTRSTTLRVDIVADASRVGPGVSSADSKLSKLGSGAAKVGKAVGAGLAVAGLAAGKLALDSIAAASRVEQATGAVETVFGRHAKAVQRWASGAADSVGLAKSEYMDLSALVGSQLQNMGVSQQASAGRSKELIKLGADLAATYGGSVADAVGAVSSLLRGEADPIERYGVGIKAADVAARMAKDGLTGLTGAALKQAETQTKLKLLTEQTTKAQGAFGRESNTLAGQQERLRAKFENTKATIGKGLLPVATKLLGWANRMLPKVLQLGRWLADKLGPGFRAVGKWITGTVVPAAVKFYNWFMEKIAPGLKRALMPVLAAGIRAFLKIRDAIKRNEPELRSLWNGFKRVAEFIANRVMPVMGKIAGFIIGRLASSIETGIDKIGAITRAFQWVIDKVRALIGWIGNIRWPSPPGWMKSAAGGIGGLFAADLVHGQPQLARRVSQLAPDSGLSTYAGTGGPGDLAGFASMLSGGRAGATVVYVAGDTYDVRADGLTDIDELVAKLDQAARRRKRKLFGVTS